MKHAQKYLAQANRQIAELTVQIAAQRDLSVRLNCASSLRNMILRLQNAQRATRRCANNC